MVFLTCALLATPVLDSFGSSKRSKRQDVSGMVFLTRELFAIPLLDSFGSSKRSKRQDVPSLCWILLGLLGTMESVAVCYLCGNDQSLLVWAVA